MGFWHLLLTVGLITWVACVFLRAVAARTCQLRAEVLPPSAEQAEAVLPSQDTVISLGRRRSPTVAQVVSRPHKGGNGSSASSGNGSGRAKVPLKRPGP
jgi:hypothetical protein